MNVPCHVQVIRSAQITASYVTIRTPVSVGRVHQVPSRTAEAKRSWAGPYKVVTEIQTRQDFIIRARLNNTINQGVAGRVGCR
jgi:hypothetical protein